MTMLENQVRKVLLWSALVLTVLLLVGAIQNLQNTPERGCVKSDSATLFWKFTCKNGHEFYEQK